MPLTDTADLKALGAFVRTRRLTLGLTQTQFANRFGGTQERVSVLEHGKSGLPSLSSMARMGAALDTPLADLLLAAGYAETANNRAGPADEPASQTAIQPAPCGVKERGTRQDTVPAGGLSIQLTEDAESECLNVTLHYNSQTYRATIQAADPNSEKGIPT